MYNFSLSILTNGTTFHAVPNKLCYFDKSCICIAMPHDIYMYTYFVLTSINLICSYFVHVQQPPHLELRSRDIPVTTGACYKLWFNHVLDVNGTLLEIFQYPIILNTNTTCFKETSTNISVIILQNSSLWLTGQSRQPQSIGRTFSKYSIVPLIRGHLGARAKVSLHRRCPLWYQRDNFFKILCKSKSL